MFESVPGLPLPLQTATERVDMDADSATRCLVRGLVVFYRRLVCMLTTERHWLIQGERRGRGQMHRSVLSGRWSYLNCL